jgi:hypothetical protein
MGLQLFVRNAADVVIVDLRGKATIGRANDFLDSQLRQLIELGTSKLLVSGRCHAAGFFQHRVPCTSVYYAQASRCELEIAATARKCEVGS